MNLSKNILTCCLIIAVLGLTSACQQSYYSARALKRDILTVTDYQRASAALDAQDVQAAQKYVTRESYQNRYKEVGPEGSWGQLEYRAAKIIVDASNNGKAVRDDALNISYVTLFNVGEGLPENPSEMLGYMHKAVAMRIANPRLFQNIDSAKTRTTFSQQTLVRYAVWQYLSDGGEINWKKKPLDNAQRHIAGESYRAWNIKLRKALWDRGEVFLNHLNKDQFIHDTIDYSLFPQIACVAQRKGWKLTLPEGHRLEKFRGRSGFNVDTCEWSE